MSKPGTAAVLSLFIPGIGQIYNKAQSGESLLADHHAGLPGSAAGGIIGLGLSPYHRPIWLIHTRKRQASGHLAEVGVTPASS